MNKQQLIAAFADKFAGANGSVYASPGRINLIGELYDVLSRPSKPNTDISLSSSR